MALFIGLISGTSVDAIDAVLCDIHKTPNQSIKLLHSLSYPYPESLQQQLLDFGKSNYQGDPIDQLGKLDHQVALHFVQAVQQLLDQAKCSPEDIVAIGSHGQTVRHRPDSRYPFTLQIGDGNIVAAKTGIKTVADFRRRDMAHGGQGAPFAPAFHQAFFADEEHSRAVVNLGGIANFTLLQPGQTPVGFDTGPANTLMDHWIFQHQQLSYDIDGRWASSGKVIPEVLERLLDDPFFNMSAPKSTGCEYFNLDWLHHISEPLELAQYLPQDVQRTLLELTAHTVASSILRYMDRGQVYLCGGGAHNPALRTRLKQLLPLHTINDSSQLGIAPDWVEAMTFAWFASKTIAQEAIALSSITGASQNSILGAIYSN
ncbi:anhydro-N-acetylmuramic acid kinase [Kangiella japonica]|uniref:Anhydro-N-acetylmuramic acid kinase n=1 Tax=Kangiella japonica TaxID=647384 RepID=A0ABP3CN87_9GAMM